MQVRTDVDDVNERRESTFHRSTYHDDAGVMTIMMIMIMMMCFSFSFDARISS